ncbi:hypothetical protein PPYR_00800 [Photinus pyralis]|uniref:Uncharacterized protein n=1 Tax=Photinus pyralis TaxID=7054 RepID=A0A5N4B371_PHOPY|nr:hypothetical protein PPYR_00800 [Photinus pyralis]
MTLWLFSALHKIANGIKRRHHCPHNPDEYNDHLHPEGPFYDETTSKTTFTGEVGPRPSPIRRNTWTKIEGDFTTDTTSHTDFVDFSTVEKTTIVKKREDNLIVEGDMTFDTSSHVDFTKKVTPVEPRRKRTWTKDDVDKFYGTEEIDTWDIHRRDDYSTVTTVVDKVKVIKHEDNLHVEGEFTDTRSRDDYKVVKGERFEPVKPQDNLKPEGEFTDKRTSDEYRVVRGDRAQVIIREDNLKYTPGDRPRPKKPQDNLKPEGDFDRPTPSKVHQGERVEIVKHQDNLRPEGDFTGTPRSRDDFKPAQGDRAPIRKPQDNLKITEYQENGVEKSHYTTTTRQTFDQTPKKESPVTPGRTTVSRRKHMESSFTLGDDTTVMKTTNQTNYNTYTRRTDRQNVKVDTQNVQRTDKVVTSKTSDTRTLADGSIVTTTTHTTKTASGSEKSPSPVTTVVHRDTTGNHIQKSSSQTRVQESHQHTEQVNRTQQSNIVHSASHHNVTGSSTVKTDTHHRRNVMQTEADITNQVLHRKGVHTSTEALHATSSAALAQRKSISNLHDQGNYINQSTDRRSLSSIHRSNVQEAHHARRGQEWSSATYTYERPQKIVRQDNLSVGGHFYGQSEAHSYGNFTKQQNIQKVERVSRKSNISNINLGESHVTVVTSYKNEFAPRHTGPCPASLIDKPKGPFKHTRDTKSHKFYMPVVQN